MGRWISGRPVVLAAGWHGIGELPGRQMIAAVLVTTILFVLAAWWLQSRDRGEAP